MVGSTEVAATADPTGNLNWARLGECQCCLSWVRSSPIVRLARGTRTRRATDLCAACVPGTFSPHAAAALPPPRRGHAGQGVDDTTRHDMTRRFPACSLARAVLLLAWSTRIRRGFSPVGCQRPPAHPYDASAASRTHTHTRA